MKGFRKGEKKVKKRPKKGRRKGVGEKGRRSKSFGSVLRKG